MLSILAASKIILYVYLAGSIILVYKKARPLYFLLSTAIAVLAFAVILLYPLQKMWWGNTGDELFTGAYLAKVLLSNPLHDFYYDWLPVGYPPLYFWATGVISKLFFAHNAVTAFKIGIIGVLVIWFFSLYLFKKRDWFWVLLPIVYLSLLDFDSVMLKPYEAISALASSIFVGVIYHYFYKNKWPVKYYIWFGVAGALIFLTYYFWWVFLVPTLLVLSKNNFKRLIVVGLIIFILTSVFWLPMVLALFKHGLENAQGNFMVVSDFNHLLPVSFLGLAGLFGLFLGRHKSIIRANLVLIGSILAWQFFNAVLYLSGTLPILPSKGMWFLGTASLAMGLTYLILYFYEHWLKKQKSILQNGILIVGIVFLSTRLPFGNFIEQPKILDQLNQDLPKNQTAVELSRAIKDNVPDYKSRTWLSSGYPEINLYLPLSYFIAYNIHFSNIASGYSDRFAYIKQMTESENAQEFTDLAGKASPEIDTLLLFDDYNLHFWQDNFPYGGKETSLFLDPKLISLDYWQLVYNHNNWLIFVKK